MPAKAIIFDIGRVIVRVNLSRLLEPLADVLPSRSNAWTPQQLSPQQLWRAIEADPRWKEWQEGRLSPHEWHEYLSRQLGVTIGFDQFCHAWNHALDPDLILDESLFESLGKRHKLGLLSNTDPLHSAHLESQFPFVRYFPVRVYSWQLGSTKPKPAIYLAALEALDVSPSESLYIDDIAQYVAAAQRLGFEAIQFERPSQLLEELRRRGLLEP